MIFVVGIYSVFIQENILLTPQKLTSACRVQTSV